MAANQSVNLDEEIRRFLERGGQVQELEGYKEVPRPGHDKRARAPTADRPKYLNRGARNVKPRRADGLTEAARIKADKAKPMIKKMLDEGWKLTDIRRKLKVDWKAVRLAAAEMGYEGRSESLTRAKWVPAVERVVQGLVDGSSVKETCAREGINIGAFLFHWPAYLKNNPVAQALRSGHGPHPKTSDEDTALMLLLYQELTDISLSRACKTLEVGYHRAVRILREYPVSHPPLRLLDTLGQSTKRNNHG